MPPLRQSQGVLPQACQWYVRAAGPNRKLSQRRVWKCAKCRKQFSVLTGTIFHGTKVPIETWLMVMVQMCSAKNGISAREIERMHGVTPETAWYMLHRLREAMKREPLVGMLSGTIVADETWIGGNPKNKPREQAGGEPARLNRKDSGALTGRRETGEIRSQVMPSVTARSLRRAIPEQVNMAKAIFRLTRRRYYRDRQGVPISRVGQPSAGEYVRDGADHEPGGGLLRPAQAVDRRHPPPCQPGAPALLPGRVRLPLLDLQAGGQRAAAADGQPGSGSAAQQQATDGDCMTVTA